jgi:hypothetical protein
LKKIAYANFWRLKNILKFVKENTKQALLPANQFLLIVVDINIYWRISLLDNT